MKLKLPGVDQTPTIVPALNFDDRFSVRKPSMNGETRLGYLNYAIAKITIFNSLLQAGSSKENAEKLMGWLEAGEPA